MTKVSSSIKGTHSQLIAASACLAAGFNVLEPLSPSPQDYVLYDPKTDKFLKAQVKTIFLRTDKQKDYFVVFSRKNNKRAYTKKEVDVIIGVYGSEVYLIDNTKQQQEYWCQVTKTNEKWKKLNPFEEMMVM